MDELWKRPLFTDGFNSFAHVVFGAISTRSILIAIGFLIYQLQNKENFLVDMGEWFFGFLLGLFF